MPKYLKFTLLIAAILVCGSSSSRADIIDWSDVNGTIAGTPSLGPSNLLFNDVNGISGLDLVVSIAATNQGGGMNLDSSSPTEFMAGGVSNVDNLQSTTTANSGSAFTFTFNRPVQFTVENAQFRFFGATERIEVSSSAQMTGVLLDPLGPETITSGPASSIVALGNGGSGTNVGWSITSGVNAAFSFTVDFSRSDGAGRDPFSINITPVPEPGTGLALLFGFAPFVLRRRR